MRLFSLSCVIFVIALTFLELSSGRQNEVEKVEARIAGGQPVDQYKELQFLNQIQLYRPVSQFCSGIIITDRNFLTAAHCVTDMEPGEVNLTYASTFRGHGFQTRIEKIKIHPEYNRPLYNFDVALLRSECCLRFHTLDNERFGPASLVPRGTLTPRDVIVSGFGYTENQASKSDQIRFVILPTVNNMVCQMYYPEIEITKNMFCAFSFTDMEKGTCRFDDGDPGFDESTKKLIGINVYSRDCGSESQKPSIFANLASREIHDFITQGV